MDKEEFCILTQRIRPEIVAIALHFLKDEMEAEDVAQDTLLKLWTIRVRLRQCGNIRALAKIACKNLCISKLRRQRVIPMELNEEIELISQQNAQWIMEDKENAAWLADQIEELPSTQMQILRMCQQDGLENADIAQILGISETTVRTAKCKARKALMEQLKMRKR